MKKIIFALKTTLKPFIKLLFSVFSLIIFCQALQGQVNLLNNPGFENGLTSWTPTGDVTIGNDALSGNNAAEICGPPGGLGQVVSTTPGTKYKATIRGKVRDVTPSFVKPYVRLRFLDASYTPIIVPNDNFNVSGINSSDYHEEELFATAPAGAVYVHLFFWKETDGCFIIDDAVLEEGIEAPLTYVNSNCPYDLVTNSEPGMNGAVVDFLAGSASTNCAEITTTQTEGLPSGSFFPVGSNRIYFERTNDCGDIDECCFYVVVLPENSPCSMEVAVSNVTCVPETSEWTRIMFNYEVTGTNTPGDWISQMAFGLNQGGDPDLVFVGGGFPASGFGSVYVPAGETMATQGFFIPSFNCGDNVELQCNGGPGGEIDLELSLEQNIVNPAQWTYYSVTATLNNAGLEDATEVSVSFPKPDGVVYSGGNPFSASQGTFSVFSNEEWKVGTVPAGGSATLTVNYFLLAPEASLAYAQVSAAQEQDLDSTPGNGNPPVPIEDDEASTGGGVQPDLKADLALSRLRLPANGSAGSVVEYFFDLKNIGMATADGDYLIGAYLSEDIVLDTNDLYVGSVNTGNTPIGTIGDIPGSINIPAGTAEGCYFLILKADINDEIPEFAETNNTTLINFFVGNGGSNQADLVITGFLSPDRVLAGANNHSTIYFEMTNIGGVPLGLYHTFFLYLSDDPFYSQDDEAIVFFSASALQPGENKIANQGITFPDRPPGVYYIIAKADWNDEEPESSECNNFAVIPLEYSDDISLCEITDVETVFYCVDNETPDFADDDLYTVLIHPVGMNIGQTYEVTGDFQDLGASYSGSSILGFNLPIADGPKTISIIDESFPGCQFDNFTIEPPSGCSDGTGDLTDLMIDFQYGVVTYGLSVHTIYTVKNNSSVPFGPGTVNLYFSDDDQLDAGDVLINSAVHLRAPDNYPGIPGELDGELPAGTLPGDYYLLLEADANHVISESDEDNNVSAYAFTLEGTQGVDLELSMNTSTLNPEIYSFFTVSAIITNTGLSPVTGVKVHFPKPDEVVYQGGNEFETLKGTFSPNGNEEWVLNMLDPGETVVLKVNYFLLSGEPFTPYAQVVAQNEIDFDSSPGNGACCTANEDDEAAITIQPFSAGPESSALSGGWNQIVPFKVSNIYPVPVTNELRAEILSVKDITTALKVYNAQGQLVLEQQAILFSGSNKINIDVSKITSGLYYLKLENGHIRSIPVRFIKQRL